MTRTRLLSRLAVLVVAITSLSTAAFAASPITGTNRPTTVAGANGRLAASQLVQVTAKCKVAAAAAPSLSAMLADARRAGVTVTTTDCYRELSGQVAAQQSWSNRGNSACAATPTYDANGNVVGTSMHGWGKAVDLGFGGATFTSAGYKWLKANAWRYGWNHPAWAEPGGSACPEAWHWEWVGDGGNEGRDVLRADVVSVLPSATGNGYAGVTGLGAVNAAGDFTVAGSMAGSPVNWVMVGAASKSDRNGYWLVGADGGIFTFGNAAFHGSTGNMKLNQPVVGMASTKSGDGYWSVARDGGIFSFGDAKFFGSTGGMRLNRQIVGMAATPTGGGYWLVAEDGGIFSFGDAAFYGSTGAMILNKPIVAMAPTKTGAGYWLIASDGGVFTFGDAKFFGSTGNAPPDQPVVAITPTTSGNGYWLTSSGGQIYSFGDAAYHGGV